MRVLTVLGAVGVGLGLGSAAVLAPLMMGDGSPKMEASQASSWGSQWGQQASRAAQSLTSRSSKPASTQTSETPAAAPAPAQDAKTIDFLAHPGGTPGSKAAAVADAAIVQKPWKTQVTVAPEAAAPRKLTSSKPSSEEQRQSLVRDLQMELKRVGCYEGEPNGQWGAASKRAMGTFTERVNASLPFEQPDFILLTLVQGHKGRACGQDCPTGQSLAENGRCMPNSVLAQADRSKQLAAGAAGAVAAVAVTKLSEARKPAERPSIATAWATTTTREAQIDTGSVAQAPPAVRVIRPQTSDTPLVTAQAMPPVAVAAAPEANSRPGSVLPGRMSIGAPVPVPADPSAVRAEAAPAASVPKPAPRLAAADSTATPAPSPTDPVTAATPAADAATAGRPRRAYPRPHAETAAVPAVKHAAPVAAPVIVRRAPAVIRYAAPAPQQKVASGSKSRRLVYEMFQNPGRN